MQNKKNKIRSNRGQGITEYGALIAFVAVLFVIGLLLKGDLFSSISTSYSTVNTNVGTLNKTANSPGGGL